MTESGADISNDGKYRYRLWRSWGAGSRCVFVMLNPSTADHTKNDQTIRKCMGFAKLWGHTGIEIVNLFAFRSRKPENLPLVEDPVGPRNDEAILAAVRSWDRVVCAWGNNGGLHGRNATVVRMLKAECSPTALKHTKLSQPQHPLYLPYETKLVALELP